MALQSIKPIYLEWVKKTEKKTPESMIDDLTPEFEELNSNILNGYWDDNQVKDAVVDARHKLLYAKLLYNNNRLKNPDKDWSELDKKFDILNSDMKNIDTYERNNILKNQQKSLDIISWISVILLPLTVITGYYGMNFASMGSPSTNKGPFSFRYGQIWVFFLFAVSLSITIILLKIFYK